jgi:WD40 repeat protein
MFVVDLSYSPDGRQLAAAAADQDVKVWDAQSGQELFTLAKDGAGAGAIGPGAVAYSSDSGLIASVTAYQRVKIWDARTGKEIRVLSAHASWVNTLAFRPGGSHLACACEGTSENSTIKIWDAQTGQEVATLEWPGAVKIACLVYSPDGQHLVAGSPAGVIRWWNAATGREEHTLRGHTGQVTRLAFAPNGQRLASASLDGTVKLWDTAIGQEVMSLTRPGNFTSIAFDAAGTHLAAVGRGDIRIWDATPLPD